jgi:hypothetical protein
LFNYKTIVDNSRSNININNKINVSNNNKPKNKNMHKINSTSNIKNPMNMNININMNNNNKNKICLHEGSCTNILDSKLFTKSPLTLELETIKVNNRKKIFYPKGKKNSDISNNKNKDINSLKHSIFNNKNNSNSNKASKDKIYYLDSWIHNSSNSNNQNEEIFAGGYCPTSTINVKKESILEELHRKKNIILPYKKEINNINININDYNIHGGSLTSRTSNNVSKKKNKKKNNLINKKE